EGSSGKQVSACAARAPGLSQLQECRSGRAIEGGCTAIFPCVGSPDSQDEAGLLAVLGEKESSPVLAKDVTTRPGVSCVGYLSLYRKWRPQSFDDVVGQEHV